MYNWITFQLELTQQELTQHCKSTIDQFKNIEKNSNV